ncbi:MAG: ATP-binding protein [Salibacteraceae bacterium]
MKIENPNQIAFFIASCVTGVGLLILGAFQYLSGSNFTVWVWIAFIVLSFSVTFGLSWWAVEKFVHGKIKMIYRSIQSPEKIADKLRMATKSRDALGEVQKDVREWANVKQKEIQSLKEQAKFRRDFVGNLAHELRTPIFNMQGYLLTLLEGGLEDEKINFNYLQRADENLERLIALVEDLDSISKLEGGREELKIKKHNLVKLTGKVFDLFELQAKKKNIELRYNKKYEKPIQVSIDKDKIVQVFTNLVANAIHYGNEDGFCEIRFYDVDKNILIEVKDDGLGIEEEHLSRLFERFYRVDKSRSRHEGGTGLGLAIVKHIIESHGQTINVRSKLGEGTTFSFTLPKA